MTSESRDGTGAADNDREYTFGMPVYAYVDTHAEARLTTLRARIARSVVPMRPQDAVSREQAAFTIECGAQIRSN